MKRNIVVRILLSAVGAVIVVMVILRFLTPSFEQLDSECRRTVEKDPRSKSLEAWLLRRKIPYQKRDAPFDEMFKDVLVANGLDRAQIETSRTCIYFEYFYVRGGFPASHYAYGYFIFGADGSLISYRFHDTYQFL